MLRAIVKKVLPTPMRRALRTMQSNLSPAPKIDVSSQFNFIPHAPFGESWTACGAPRKTINWVIPNVEIGGGGHLNIFRFIRNLEAIGWENRIVIPFGCTHSSERRLEKFIAEHYLPIAAKAYIGRDKMPPAWITMATEWRTAYTVRDFRTTAKKCYFVQDFEPLFFTPGSESAFAEQTYRFGLHGITAGNWLADKLRREYQMTTDWVGFAYDKDLYLRSARHHEGHQVFFYARPHTHRRGFELGILALTQLAQRIPKLRVLLAGGDATRYAFSFQHKHCGVVPVKSLSALYNQCDAALVLSFTNLSLLPLELFACGCPVVSNRGPNIEWLLNDSNAVLAEPTVESITDANRFVKMLWNSFAKPIGWPRRENSMPSWNALAMSNAKCLILGATGFIGMNLCMRLCAAGVPVRAFARTAPRGHNSLAGVQWLRGDFLNADDVRSALTGCNLVYHLVSTTIPATSNQSPYDDARENILGTLQVLDLMRETAVPRIVFVSTGGAIYGAQPKTPVPETAVTNPISAYGIGKLAIEKYLALYERLAGITYCVLRVANVYGEKQPRDRSQGAVGVFLAKAIRGETIDIWGDGEVIRDYVHVDDVTSALTRAAAYDGESQIFNIGSGKGHSLNQLLALMESQLGFPIARRYLPARSLDVPVSVLNISRARRTVTWMRSEAASLHAA
jgi:nucleoside-diphosphate-sugar epimerase/glycosyltransferase involved in cell wall biosynthesis